jgi:CheY-like chemotaxis protein
VTAGGNAKEKAAQSEAGFSGKRLLLVEDNMVNLKIAEMILTCAGFAVETAENGQLAVDMVSASEPGDFSAILMDIQMPVMDGYEATRAIRALNNRELAEIPIVALTSNAFREDLEATKSAGMDAHIAKPVDVQKMLSTLRSVLEQKISRRKSAHSARIVETIPKFV